MRVFEIITVISVLIVIVSRMIRKSATCTFWEYLIAVPAILHIVFEGVRWQMYGVYVIAAVILLFRIKKDLRPGSGQSHKNKRLNVSAILIASLTLVLLLLFPVRNMREPSGPYNVGTIAYDLVDESRIELYGDREGDDRKIRIQLWYPTDDDIKGDTAPWIMDGNVVPRALMKRYNAPFFVYDHLTLIDSNSHVNAPLNNEIQQMPVVVISHGWTGFRNLHTDLGELFASMGYLAVGIDHTYGSVGLEFESGETALLDPDALPDRNETDSFPSYAANLVDTYSRDIGTILGHLDYLNSISDIFKGHIDIDRIGAIGHSTGGGGVVKQAMGNPMIKAVVGLDPWVEPIGEDMLLEGMNQPALFFRSTSWAGGINDGYVEILVADESARIENYEISGSNHQDFSMLYQMGPVPKLLGIAGDMDSYESAKIQQVFITNFMNRHLLGEEDATARLLDEYESVFRVEYDLGN